MNLIVSNFFTKQSFYFSRMESSLQYTSDCAMFLCYLKKKFHIQ
jgi:hypothetical protein